MANAQITTSSLIAVGQVVGSIITCSYYYQHIAKGASQDTRGLILEAQSLRNVVEGLMDKMPEDESRSSTGFSFLPGALSEGRRVFGECWNHLSQLEERLREPVERWNTGSTSLTWPMHEIEVDDTLECLRWLKTSIESGPSIEPVHRTAMGLQDTILDLNQRTKMSNHEHLQAMFGWLDALDPSSIHNNVRMARIDRTGTWLLSATEFKKWRNSTDMAVLWMHGIPGCGKSVLTSSVIDYLRHSITIRPDGQNAALAYFYFQFSDPGRLTVNTMLRSLISQLSSSHVSPTQTLEKNAYQHFENSGYPREYKANYREGISQPSTDELTSILRGITEELGQVFLVIDGLDECADQDSLHKIVDTISGWNVQQLHIFLSSRFNRKLKTILEGGNRQIVEMTPEIAAEDMQSFTQKQLVTRPKLRK